MIEKERIIISIIIPVYNCEKYLNNCLDSIMKQTYRNFEVIIVDDGSTDNSSNIYRYYEENYDEVKIIKQKNSGVSSARNKGIDSAIGEYLLFIDSDDMIKEDMLNKMYKFAIENDADIVLSGFEVKGSSLRSNDTNVLKKCCNGKNVSVITNEEVIARVILTDPEEVIYGYIWRNLYKANIINKNKIRFSEGIKISEDFMFLLEVLDKCKNVVITPEEFYIYSINDDSVTVKYIDTIHKDMDFINNWMFNNICNKYEVTLEGYYCCVANTYLGVIQNISRSGTPFSFINRIKLVYKLKKEYKYNDIINKTWKKKNKFRKKAWVSMVLFKFNLECIYITLFSLKGMLRR